MKRTQIFSLFLVIALFTCMALNHTSQATVLEIPSTKVSTLDDLLTAIEFAEDDEVIGIDGFIEIPTGTVIGKSDKTIKLLRMNDIAKLTSVQAEVLDVIHFQNIILDGSSIVAGEPFLSVGHYTQLDNCQFVNIICYNSAGIITYGSEIRFNNCEFESNKGYNGGHLAGTIRGSIYLDSCILKKGISSSNGGAVSISGTTNCIIQNSIITENQSSGFGGGIYFDGDYYMMENTKLYNNVAEEGGDDYAAIKGQSNFRDSKETLTILFESEELVPLEWSNDSRGRIEEGMKFLKLVFQEISEPDESDKPIIPEEPDETKKHEEIKESINPINSSNKDSENATSVQPSNTNNSIESNPSNKITVEEPLGNVENHITITTPPNNILESSYNGYMTSNNNKGTSTPIEQTITVETANLPTGNLNPNELNINVNINDNSKSIPKDAYIKSDASITWVQIVILCLLFGILCCIIMFAIFFFKKE